MVRKRYTRQQVARLLQIDEGFILQLEEELVVEPSYEEGPVFTERDCDRIRMAHTLIQDLDVNLPGASIILRMRDQIEAMQRQFHEALELIREAAIVAERRRTRR